VSAQPITCQQLVELVTDYLEGTLTPVTRGAFEAHLGVCPGCVTYLDQMRETVRVTGTLTEEQLDPAVRDELLGAFRDFKRR
jgi:predicted anti-sigma-YlaC factor YlaD